MSHTVRRFSCLQAAVVVALVACVSDTPTTKKEPQTLELRSQPATQPALTDVPAVDSQTPKAEIVKAAPVKLPPPPARTKKKRTDDEILNDIANANVVDYTKGPRRDRLAVVRAGETLELSSLSQICTSKAAVNDMFVATTDSPVGPLPAGTNVYIELTSVERSENQLEPVKMGFAARTLRVDGVDYPINAETKSAAITTTSSSTKAKSRRNTLMGGLIGAAVGYAVGKDAKSAAIGAGVGAAGTAAATKITSNVEGCLPIGGHLTIALRSDLSVPVGH